MLGVFLNAPCRKAFCAPKLEDMKLGRHGTFTAKLKVGRCLAPCANLGKASSNFPALTVYIYIYIYI